MRAASTRASAPAAAAPMRQPYCDMPEPTPSWRGSSSSMRYASMMMSNVAPATPSVIAATATNLRNVELARLSLDDLTQVASIGVYWDTLGWVYFRQGNLDQAERYLSAQEYELVRASARLLSVEEAIG